MSLKLSDALRLSWSNIVQYKKRSILIILTISILFGFIMGASLVVSGLEQTLISASAEQTGGDIYLEARYGNLSNIVLYDHIRSPEEVSLVNLTPVLDEFDEQKIADHVTKYGGEIVGYRWYYQIACPYNVITKAAVEPFIDSGLWESLPDDKIPTLMPEGWTPYSEYDIGDLASMIDNLLGDSLYRVGETPTTESGYPVLSGFNPLNLFLSQLYGGSDYDFWLVDDGSGKVEAFIRSQLTKYLAENHASFSLAPIEKNTIVKFNNLSQARAFSGFDSQILGINYYSDSSHIYSYELFGTTLHVDSAFRRIKLTLIFIGIMLLVVATIISALTFVHLIDQDANTIALYRAMGASSAGIHLVYFLYLIELCLLAIVAAAVIALLLVAAMAIMNSAALASRLRAFYNLKYSPEVTFFGLSIFSWLIPALILLVAPLTLLCTSRHFSARNIAKHLKDD